MKGCPKIDRICAEIVTTSSLRGGCGRGKFSPNVMKTKFLHSRASRAFSLIELLAVIAVIAVMTSLIAPAVSGFSSTAGRRGAVNILMNTFEQARVAALESGQNVYVGFADADFPVADMRYASFMVFRDATEEEVNAGQGSYVILKKWTRLPKNVSFKRLANSLVPLAAGQTFTGLASLQPSSMQDETMPVVTFNSSGAITGGSSPLQLFVYDGYYANNQDNFTRNSSDLFEKITLSRYTGRAQLDVTTTATQ
jgi:prepilin-type N-terminal cleavage/methylation domain-containing protein